MMIGTNYESCLNEIGKNTSIQYRNKPRTAVSGSIASNIQHQYPALTTTTTVASNYRSTFSSNQESHLKTKKPEKKTKTKRNTKTNIQATRSNLSSLSTAFWGFSLP